jgi:hypothetical protein
MIHLVFSDSGKHCRGGEFKHDYFTLQRAGPQQPGACIAMRRN